jgi:hypothetical protein
VNVFLLLLASLILGGIPGFMIGIHVEGDR